MQLSRYIHRNPLEANIVSNLEDYPWSSYSYYVDKRERPPEWLYRHELYSQLGAKSRRQEKYKSFVEQGVDDELAQFYGKGIVSPCLGSDEFRSWAYDQRVTSDEAVNHAESIQFRPGVSEVVAAVAALFKVTAESILVTQRGGSNNVP